MPISFLKKIKHLDSSGSDHTRIAPSVDSEDHVEGFYVFPCKGMRSKQLLFNDGFPVMIFMPERHNRIKVTVEGQVTVMESVWLCGGILKNREFLLDYILNKGSNWNRSHSLSFQGQNSNFNRNLLVLNVVS